MRNWTIEANDSWDNVGQSEAGEAIRQYLSAHPEAKESDVERIARSYHCSVYWTLQPNTVSQQLEDMGLAQIQLPDLSDDDLHPRLLVAGEGVHAGQSFEALFPDGWHVVTLEIRNKIIGPSCWYISTPGYENICPIGLFVKW